MQRLMLMLPQYKKRKKIAKSGNDEAVVAKSVTKHLLEGKSERVEKLLSVIFAGSFESVLESSVELLLKHVG